MPYMPAAVRDKLQEMLVKLGVIGEDNSKKLLMLEQYYDGIIKEIDANGYQVAKLNNTQSTENTDLKRVIDENKKTFNIGSLMQVMLYDYCVAEGWRYHGDNLKGGSYPVFPCLFTDATYQVLDLETLKHVLRETKIDVKKYQAEGYDCEDFARKLTQRFVDLGINSVGRCFAWQDGGSKGHSFNIAAVYNGDKIEYKFVEPQTDKILDKLEGIYDMSQNCNITIA